MAEGARGGTKAGSGSAVPFWCVMGAAALLLLVYLFLPKGGGRSPGGPGPGSDAVLRERGGRKPMPNFLVKRYDGEETVSLGDVEGKVCVFHLWATWCPPCRSEFPDFARYAAEAGPGVEVIALSLDGNPADIRQFAGTIQEMPPVYLDPQATLVGELGTRGVPETILVDSKGRIAFRASGAQDWGSGGVPQLVRELLEESG